MPLPVEVLKRERKEVRTPGSRTQRVIDEMTIEMQQQEGTEKNLKRTKARRDELEDLLDEENRASNARVANLNFKLGDMMANTKQMGETVNDLMLCRDDGPDPEIVREAEQDAEAVYAAEIGELKKVVKPLTKRANGKRNLENKLKKSSLLPPDSIPTVMDSVSFVSASELVDVTSRSFPEPSGIGGTPVPSIRRPPKRKALRSMASLQAVFDSERETSEEEPSSTPRRSRKPLTAKQYSRDRRNKFSAFTVAIRRIWDR